MQYSRWTQETEKLNLKLAHASKGIRTQVAQSDSQKKKKKAGTKEELGKIPCTSFNWEELNRYRLLL